MSFEQIDAPALLDRLNIVLERATAKSSAKPMVVFDADGTLWRGDVGYDLFYAAVEGRVLREHARENLLAEARHAGVDEMGGDAADLHQVALRLAEANLRGEYDDARAFAMMAWIFAGFTEAEMLRFAAQVVARAALSARIIDYVAPVLDWARRTNVEVVICSASPRAIVLAGVELLGIDHNNVIAVTPHVNQGVIAPRVIDGPIPYAEGKPVRIAEHRPSHTLIAGFGDSAADAHFMRLAHLAVGVSPQPRLRALELPNMVVV